jgi:hypothetical protein
MTSKWFVPGPHDDAPLTADRAASSEWFAPTIETSDTPAWEKQAMVEWLQDAAVGSTAPITSRKVLAPTVVKMDGYALADFEADRRQQVLHDRIAELRRRGR